ncbi:MAG TPA: bleomycin resistance family protein [Cyclobacteriaceae bacterium]|nr:bleomycin resistance family protein [Cyclobacteriaceae bacterium]
METKPKLESLSPNVIVEDVNAAVEYYTKIFGFNLIASVPESGVYNWAMVMRDGVTLMFQSLRSLQEDMPSLKIQSKGSLGTFFIRMTGIEALYQSVKGKITIVVDMRTTFYGMKEFTVKDLNGYFLTFAEDVK